MNIDEEFEDETNGSPRSRDRLASAPTVRPGDGPMEVPLCGSN